MNKTCGIVRDLMPLVIDRVSCKESTDLVETHMAVCPECAEYYKEMKAGIPAGDEKEKKEESAAFTQAARKLRRKRRWRTLRLILVSIVVAFALFAAGMQLYRGLQHYTVPLYTGQYRIFLSQLQDGSVAATADYNGSSVQLYNQVEDTVEKDPEIGEQIRVAYLRIDKTLIPDPVYNPPMQNEGFIRFSAEEISNRYDEIRQGRPEDYKTLWKKGDVIEKASAEMEEYYCLNDLWNSLFHQDLINPGNYSFWIWFDALNQQMTAVKSVVPEWQPWDGGSIKALDQETFEIMLAQLENAGFPIDRSKIHSLKPAAVPAPEQ